jgi:hypothetical protein
MGRENSKGIAPGAERRRVHVGDCAGRGAPARSCQRLRRARSASAFPLGVTSISSSARGAPLAHRLGIYGPLAHLNEFDRRGHKKPAPRKGRGRLTQLGGERGISFADPVVRDGFRIRNPPALARRLAFSLLPAFKQARRGHSQKNPQQMLRVS